MKLLIVAVLLAVSVEPAAAHHVNNGMMPVTFTEGLLSGLGHPIIGLDHLAAMTAVGCLAAWQRRGPLLIVAYVLAMIVGAAAHVRGTSVFGAEIMVALSVLALGVALLRSTMSVAALLALFVVAGCINGYALGESIVGAEPAPLSGYFIGLAAIQALVALVALAVVRAVERKRPDLRVPLFGAVIVGIGVAALVKDVLTLV